MRDHILDEKTWHTRARQLWLHGGGLETTHAQRNLRGRDLARACPLPAIKGNEKRDNQQTRSHILMAP